MATKRVRRRFDGGGQHAAALPPDADAGNADAVVGPGAPGAASTPEGMR